LDADTKNTSSITPNMPNIEANHRHRRQLIFLRRIRSLRVTWWAGALIPNPDHGILQDDATSVNFFSAPVPLTMPLLIRWSLAAIRMTIKCRTTGKRIVFFDFNQNKLEKSRRAHVFQIFSHPCGKRLAFRPRLNSVAEFRLPIGTL
jgi:hypothetical protein